MRIRRPLATVFTVLALAGGGATVTGCAEAGQADSGASTGEFDDSDLDRENFPDVSEPEVGQNVDEDLQDPD